MKHTETTRSTSGTPNWSDKRDAANELWEAVSVEHPERVARKDILVIDDATTTLHQINVIAGILKRAGAEHVDGLVIARSVR